MVGTDKSSLSVDYFFLLPVRPKILGVIIVPLLIIDPPASANQPTGQSATEPERILDDMVCDGAVGVTWRMVQAHECDDYEHVSPSHNAEYPFGNHERHHQVQSHSYQRVEKFF